MHDYRNHFSDKKRNDLSTPNTAVTNDTEDRTRIAFYSELFSNASGRFIATNSEYANFKDDIMGAIEPYGTKENIVLTIYETKDSDEFARESTIIGFHKYLRGCISARIRSMLKKISLFGVFLLLGIGIEVLIYAFPEIGNNLPLWISKSLEVFAGLFIWQLGGFLSFELSGEIHTIRKYRQIVNRITFDFKHFE